MARKKIIPKRIGTVKVPKALRKLGDRVLADPRAREVAGSALLAVGTALLQRGTRRGTTLRDIFERATGPARAQPRDPAEPGQNAGPKAGEAMSGMAETVTQVVGEVFDAVRRDFARKVRPVRPARSRPEDEPEDERPEGTDDRVH